MKNDAVQKRIVAPMNRHIVTNSGDAKSVIRYFEIGINTPNIRFVVRTQICPFALSEISI